MSSYLTMETLRDFAGDAAGDVGSKLTGGLTFSDDEIVSAMEAGAREFNSLPPYGVATVTADRMTKQTNMFFRACCAQLFTRRVRLLSQQAVEVQAGNTVTDPDGLARKELTALAAQMNDEFRQEVRFYKGQKNMEGCYGSHG